MSDALNRHPYLSSTALITWPAVAAATHGFLGSGPTPTKSDGNMPPKPPGSSQLRYSAALFSSPRPLIVTERRVAAVKLGARMTPLKRMMGPTPGRAPMAMTIDLLLSAQAG